MIVKRKCIIFMKKSIIAVGVAAIAGVVLLTGTGKMSSGPETTTSVSEKIEQKYILKDYMGRIAVFSDGSETPKEIYEIYTRTLPEEDAEKIKKGIEIYGPDELTKVLADYTS